MTDGGLAIIVMGVSGCGKSSVGQALAARLACPMIEGDLLHSADSVAKMARGVPLDDSDRWPWLQRLGTALGEAASDHPTAIATCSALKRVYRNRLREAAGRPIAFVHLTASHAELARRMSLRSGHYMPVSLLDSQLAVLEPPGQDELARSFDAGQAPDTLVDEIAAWLASLDRPVARPGA